MNKITLIGHLGKEPEMSYTPDGLAVTKFSTAINRTTKSQTGEKQVETDWYNVVAFGKLAETCNTYLKKGSKVYVEGRLAQRKYTDRNHVDRVALEVTLTEMELLTPKEQSGTSSSGFSGDEHDNLGDEDEHPF